jgi:GTP-binding protein Era
LRDAKGFRSGFAVLAGAPNAGKSTLMNRLAGGSLAVVSPKPQTTRENLLAICDGEDHQLVLLDTPGFLTPKYKLQELMLSSINRAVRDDADVICFVAEPFQPGDKERALADILAKLKTPVIIAVNKSDTISREAAGKILNEYKRMLSPKAAYIISAKRGDGVEELRKTLIAALPVGDAYFPAGQWTDRWERHFASEFVREQLFTLYDKEIPYSCAAVTESFQENKTSPDCVRVAVYVEKDSQKPILIGHGGSMIKKLREAAQKRLEDFLGRKVRLELIIKVAKNWRSDSSRLKEFGYDG